MAKIWSFIFLINFYVDVENLSNFKLSGHVIEQFFVRNIILHRLQITVIDANAQLLLKLLEMVDFFLAPYTRKDSYKIDKSKSVSILPAILHVKLT